MSSFASGSRRLDPPRAQQLPPDGVLVFDRWGLVGSANVDMRSFRLNFEIGALVMDDSFAGLMTRRFLEELDASVEVTTETLSRVGIHSQLAEGAARLLSPLL